MAKKKDITVGIDQDIQDFFAAHKELNRSAFIRGAIRFTLQFKEDGLPNLRNSFNILNYEIYDDVDDAKKDILDTAIRSLTDINQMWKQTVQFDINDEWKRRKDRNKK